MPDNLATLRAIDDAFTARVTLLFTEMCNGYSDTPDPPLPDSDLEKQMLRKFDVSLDHARRARDIARKRFVDPS